MSNTYTGNLDATPVVFTNEPGQFFPNDRQGTMVEIDALPPGAAVDNIFYFNSPNTGKFLKRVIDGIIRAAYCGIYPTNSAADNSTRFAAAVINSSIRTIAFDDPGGGTFNFSGTINIPNNVHIQFQEGNIWGGSAVINGGIIESSDTSQIFSTSITVRPDSFVHGYASVHMWGSFPNTYLDQSTMFQKALDCIVVNSKTKRLLIPLSGDYVVKNLSAARWDPSRNEYIYISFSIEGVSPPTDSLGGAVLVNDDPNSCTLAVQTGNNILIKNITFRGESKYVTNAGAFINWSDTEWLTTEASGIPNGIRNNRFSPHAGISIDPYLSSIAIDDRYPGLTSNYINPYSTGTSNLTIEYCNFYRFAVGIMESSSGMPNGDNIVFKNGFAYNCRTFWGCGNLQARSNQIENLYVYGGMKFLVNTGEYGTQVGCAPEIKNSSLNSIKYLYYVNGEFSGISFTGCYGENIWSFGKCTGQLPVTFNSCQFNLRIPSDQGIIIGTPLVLAEGNGALNFIGGKIEYPDNLLNMPLPFNTPQVNFLGSTIKTSLPFQVDSRKFSNVEFDGVMWATASSSTTLLTDNAHLSGDTIENYYGRPFLPGSVISDYYFQATYHSVGKKFAKEFIENAPIVVYPAECTFTSVDSSAYQYGDAIYAEDVNGNGFVDPDGFFSTKPTTLGWVSNIVGSTVTISYTPKAVVSGNFNLYIIRIPRMQSRGIGTTTIGSNIMTNISFQTVLPVHGSHMRSAGLSPGTRFNYYDPSTNSFHLSRAAIANTVDAQYYDAEVRQKFDNYATYYFGGMYNAFILDRIWYKEDEIFNVDSVSYPNIRSWYIVKEGHMTGSAPPTIVTVP